MINEFTRLWHSILADPATGVNALLPEVPRDEHDATPPACDIVNFLDTEWAATMEIPPNALKTNRGTLIIRNASEFIPVSVPANAEMRHQQPVFALVAIYGVRMEADRERHKFVRDCCNTLRCVQRATHIWFEEHSVDDPARTRNNCVVAEALDQGYFQFPTDIKGIIGWGFMLEVRMTDRWAEHII